MPPKSSVQPPSELQFIPFPPFGLKWHSTPPSYNERGEEIPTSSPTCTAYAICGGGGKAKSGVNNCVRVVITVPTDPVVHVPEGGDDNDDDEGRQIISRSHSRTVDIDTGEGCGIDVALHQDGGMLWVLVAIGNGFSIYFVPLAVPPSSTSPSCVLMTEGSFDESTTCEALSFNAEGSLFAAGYESGKISVFRLLYSPPSPRKSTHGSSFDDTDYEAKMIVEKFADLHQPDASHIKAIDTLQFHPSNQAILASCARDGTCRIWNLEDTSCIDVLRCKIYDSSRPPPADPKIADPKPGQLLVRGCAFGDVHGQILYTVQSGRRGGAFLSVWRLFLPPSPPGGGGEARPQPVYREVLRKMVSSSPVSAMSLSGDYGTLALGDTQGTVTLYDAASGSMGVLKVWKEAHETPVTCIAARPLGPQGDFPGEELTGVTRDVITASFDNKLLFLTRQKVSRLVVKGPGPGLGYYLRNLVLVLCILVLLVVSYDACREEVGMFPDFTPMQDCLVHTVFWAQGDRPGVSAVLM